MRTLLSAIVAFLALAAPGAETNVVDGATYVCEDGICRMLEDVPAAARGVSEAAGERPARMICGYRDAKAFVAFLEDAPVRDPLAGKGLWMVLLLAVLGGLAMNLTPCVLPMVPVNLIVIGRSAARGAWYGLGIVLVYGTLGILAAVGGLAFGTVQSHPLFHLGVCLVFVALGLALSGVFALDFTRYRRGLHGGAFALGALSALLAGACVAPILVSVLALTAKLFAEGSRAALALPFAVGVGLALPWPLLGAGLRVLPKPGAWMRWVNRAFALVVFALALREGALALAGWRAVPAASELDAATFARQGVAGLKRPVLVDCGASWCGNCAAMDRLLRNDPAVRRALERFTVLRVRAEDLGELRRAPGFGDVPGLPAFAVYEHPLDAVPWIGDGRPVAEGADWYAEDPAPEFCAEFVLPPGVTETKIHFACAGFGWFGLHCAFMNADGLDPLWSVYDKTVYATTTSTLKATETLNVGTIGGDVWLEKYPKKNRIYVYLGNGFYNLPPLKFWGGIPFRDNLAHGRPCFKMSIEGVKEPLVWKWRKTNVLRNSVYLGAEVDATKPEEENWQPAAVVAGPKGEIVEWPQTNPRMGCYETQDGTVKWLERKAKGEGEVQVVDFGVNASGVPDFTFWNEKPGTRVEIVYGERLNADGTVNVLTQTAGQIKRGNGGPGAPKVAAQRDVYVCRGPYELPPGTISSASPYIERFRPPFTWHVFRYAEIRGARHLVRNPARSVRSMVSTRVNLAPAARDFKTDNADLAKLHEVCQRTFQANLIGGVQSDCPGRERLGYGGDIVATCEAMCLNFDMKEIYLKILRDFADEAADDGWITETAPFVGIADQAFGPSRRAGPISWAVAVPVLMDTLIRHYPDAKDRALAFYPTCARYVRLVDAVNPSGIVPRCIGDHEALERAPNDVTATAHGHQFAALTAKFAKMLGKEEDAAEFERIDAKIRAAFAAKYVKDGVVANGTQSAQAIGLYLGLVPAAQIPAAEARLLKAVEEKDFAPHTGIFATRYMLMYLAEHGHNDVARRIVLHRGFPGWLHMLERGATTLWETWRESDDVYSNCHPMFGSVDEWILRMSASPRLTATAGK